jgi:hypothetical protein
MNKTTTKGVKPMKSFKSALLVLSSVGLFFLAAFSSDKQTSNSRSSPTTSPEQTAQSGHPNVSQGGQVVEQGAYHLEFVPAKEKDGVHLDFYLQKGDNHQAIPNAKVTGQVQLPNGNQKNLTFKYDASGKHYTAFLAEKASGQYQVRITADMNGQKVNGRFSFQQ